MKICKITRAIRKILPLQSCGAVIVAAGTASRMGGIDKIMAPLGGEPVILRTIRAFQESEVIQEIVVVTRDDLIEPIQDLCRDLDKVRAVVCGGSSRPESVEKGLDALSKKVKLAAIQDGARPLVSWQVIDRTVRAAHSYGAAAPAIPVKDTIKQTQCGFVTDTPDRSALRAVQTPQVFDRDLLRAALEQAAKKKRPITDDCSAVELMGATVRLVEGEERNIKITTPLDLKIAEMLLEEER